MNKILKKRKIFLKIIFVIFVFCLFGFFNYSVEAGVTDPEGAMTANAIDIKAKATDVKIDKSIMENIKGFFTNIDTNLVKWAKDAAASKAFKEALRSFLKRMAYDTATYLATGDKGQAPMFQTDSVGGFLSNAADYAAGDFLGALSRGALGARFNICELDPNLKLQLGLGLMKEIRPKEPDCTFSEMKKNWEESLQDPNFLNRFQAVFDPRQNDLGRALTVHSGFGAAIDNKLKQSELELAINQGWKNVTEPISELIKTPGNLVRERAKKALNDSDKAETIFTGDLVADAIDTFINTLISKLMEKWFTNGLVMKFPNNSYNGNWGGFDDPNVGPYKEGIKGAEERFLGLTEPSFNVRGDYEVLRELTACPDPQKAGPTNCVITDKFRQAVAEKLSVGEAMKKGYLNSAGIFGFNADGLEPNFNEGYPYRSMLILRKFRIIPVGWELAAEYIDNNQKTVGAKNLNDLVACFNATDEYGDYYQPWCDGLVDPNWVLKAPLNFCKKEGFGPEITTRRVMGTGNDSELIIGRSDSYCADEQACIKENDNGSCELYGYCTEEKRKWDFNGESCEPVYNTCQTFKGQNGQNVSYLENTLDFSGCDTDNVGCTEYCQDYDVSSDKYTCDSISGKKIYLDASAEACSDSSEGCHEFIRTKSGIGANLFFNSSFEDVTTWPQTVDDSYDGSKSIKLGVYVPGDDTLLDLSENEADLAGLPITFSLFMKNCGENVKIAIGTGQGGSILSRTEKLINTSSSDWRRYEVTHFTPNEISRRQIFFDIEDYEADCLFDAVKIEFGEKATAYSDYRKNGLFNEKIIPEYLNNDCYVSANTGNYTMKSGYPKECDNYSRLCNSGEVGCTMYKAVKDSMSIPAKVMPDDYCPEECVGYDEYHQMSSAFDSQRPFYFVPLSAKKCSNAAVGCDEFTNLDKLGAGAEAREYYSELKQCRKPDDQCQEFYTWEGSGDTGFQLRVYQMETDGLSPYGPKQTRNTIGDCDANIYALPATDPAYNPDCREFYNKNGEITYRLYSLAISCSDNCHPYRRTENNILENTNKAQTLCEDECGADVNCINSCTPIDCENSSNGKVCEFDNTTAVFCQNGGLWNSQHGRCLYNAIPGEGRKCSDSQAGCREYSGASGNNINFILNTDIESGTTENWSGDLPPALNPSSEALLAGGHSLYVSGADNQISKELGYILNLDKSYTISFIAKKDAMSSASRFTEIGFGLNSVSISFELGSVENYELGSDWKLYRFNLTALNNATGNYTIDNSEKIFIKGDGAFYIDSIRLSEITDRYFLIKNSWTIDACLYDTTGAPQGNLYNLGCAAYTDNDNVLYNLRKFSMLCQDSAVGCELMIDTHNSTSYASSTSPSGITPSVNIPNDSFVYAVYNKNQLCNSKDKGCERLGKPYYYGNTTLYDHVYLKNDPDRYDNILCDQGAIKCESWNTNSGVTYFKDPVDQVCEYRTKTGDNSQSWYKKYAKKCDKDDNDTISGLAEIGDDNVCRKDADCMSGIKCLDDKNDYLCDVTSDKTIGLGGLGGRVNQPDNNWVGICSASESGCSEYIDPISRFSKNIIFNPEYGDIDNDGSVGDGWNIGNQDVVLTPNTLYVLRSFGLAGDVTITGCNDLRVLNNNNTLILGTPVVNESNLLFVSGSIRDCVVNGGQFGKTVELKEAVIDYQLKQKLEKNACNGLVDFEKGCTLLNERTVGGGDGVGVRYAELLWDANETYDDKNGIAAIAGANDEDNDSNILVKAMPDRTCKTWLSCKSFIKDENNNNVCYDVGLCDRFDSNGNCANAVQDNSGNLTYSPGINVYSDYSGYVKVGYGDDDKFKRNDYYSLGNMEQQGEISKVSNGDFELFGTNSYPLGWNSKNDVWSDDKFSVINNPWIAEKEGVKYPMIGKSFLRYSPQRVTVESEFFDIEPGADYILSAYMNTMNFAVDYISSNNDLAVGVIGIITYDKFGVLTNTNQGGKIVIGGDFSECANQPLGVGCQIYLGQKNDWTSIKTKFKVGGSTAKIRLEFYGYWQKGFKPATGSWTDAGDCKENDRCVGSVYVDDVKIYPVLHAYSSDYESPVATNKMNMQWLSNRWQIDWLKEETCRLYPEDDSLSCEYLNDSGVKKKGLYGYCLEYDRYPGNKDACLLWYPIDKVKGDGIEEGAGYLGKYPAYYCVEKADLVKLEKRKFIYNGVTTGCDWDSPPSPSGNYSGVAGSGRAVGQCGGDCDDGDSNYTSSYAPNKNNCIYECQDDGTGWYVYDGFEYFDSGHCCNPAQCDVIDEAKDGVKYYDPETKMVFDDFSMKCTKIVQTVTPIGQNKFWSGRVYKGSDYQYSCNVGIPELDDVCIYTSDAEPFGSVTPPGNTWSEITNPYEWVIPLYYKSPKTEQARMGQLQAVPGVQRIFAQNYGSWKWSSTDSRYIKDNILWTPPDSECLNRMRNYDEYCYITPKITNLKADKYFVDNSGFVNLTFNTKIDSQQLPLVMYSIDWGDGGSLTTVSGVEMRDRQNPAIPHSSYHLYSYWDMRKNNLSSCNDVDKYCEVEPKVKIKDNWGKETAWVRLGVKIKIYEKAPVVNVAECDWNGGKIKYGEGVIAYRFVSANCQNSCESQIRVCGVNTAGVLSGSFTEITCAEQICYDNDVCSLDVCTLGVCSNPKDPKMDGKDCGGGKVCVNGKCGG